MAAIAVAALLLGLLVILLFKQFTESMWTAWCSSVAGTAVLYSGANVISKKLGGKTSGKK